MKNKEAVTIALDWDMIVKCGNYLVAYVGELDFDISREWGSDEMSELVPQTLREAQIESLSWIRYRYKFRKKRRLLL